MILADTSVWIDHLRSGDDSLFALLDRAEIVMHPFVIGELMLGGLSRDVLADVRQLPPAPLATAEEVQALIEARSLNGRGIGYVDAALLASVCLRAGAGLWSRDRRLAAVAAELAVAVNP